MQTGIRRFCFRGQNICPLRRKICLCSFSFGFITFPVKMGLQQWLKALVLRPEIDMGSGFRPLLGAVHAAACGFLMKGLGPFMLPRRIFEMAENRENGIRRFCIYSCFSLGNEVKFFYSWKGRQDHELSQGQIRP